MSTELKQFSKEMYDIMDMFERTIQVYAYVPSEFDKAEKKLWTKGYYYNNGKVNELFRVFLGGYTYGKAEGGAE